MITGWQYFDRTYCIHLPDADRRKNIAAQFYMAGIAGVEYVHAKEPHESFRMSNQRRNSRNEFGCALSHIRAVLEAIMDGAKRPLFFEDDVVFRGPERITQVIDELPDDWQVLYFGGHPREPAEMVSDNLAHVGTFSFAEGYALRNPAAFLAFWLNRIGQPNAMYDIVLGEYCAETEKGYCVFPLMTYQPEGWSRIGNKIDNKDGCLNKGWQSNLSTRSALESGRDSTKAA